MIHEIRIGELLVADSVLELRVKAASIYAAVTSYSLDTLRKH
jgi:hypothetical protein